MKITFVHVVFGAFSLIIFSNIIFFKSHTGYPVLPRENERRKESCKIAHINASSSFIAENKSLLNLLLTVI